jgi:Tol biopolymer transport system component
MPDVQEVFRMATQKVRPDPGAMERQYAKQRRAARNRRLGAIAMVAAIVAAFALVFVLTRPSSDHTAPATKPPPTSTTASSSPLSPAIVGLDGRVQSILQELAPDAWTLSLSPDATKIAYITRSTDVGSCGGCADVARLTVAQTDGTNSHFVPIPGESHFTVDPNRDPPARGLGPVSNLPAWSPDGSRIAIVVTKNGNTDIYVMDADGSHQRRLTTSPADDEFPSWSPDGSSIVYDSSGSTQLDDSGLSPTQEIWSVPVAGGTPVRLTNNHLPDQAPVYSPDGTTIAFFEPDGITLMDADGGNVRPLAGGSGGWTPRWSPDGRRIAFLDFTGGEGSAPAPTIGDLSYSLPLGTVKVVDLATGKVSSLPFEVPTSYNAVSWMPSSDALLVNRYQQP